MLNQEKEQRFFKISESQLLALMEFFNASDVPSTKERPATSVLVAKVVRVFDQIQTQPIKLPEAPKDEDLEDDAVFSEEE